jgi:transposase
LTLYIYGYFYRLRPSRRLEQETHRNVELMWLLQKLRPAHKTIANFRRDHLPPLRQVRRAFTLLCKQLNLFSGELVAIDGSKFQAGNAKERNFTHSKLRRRLEATGLCATRMIAISTCKAHGPASASWPV